MLLLMPTIWNGMCTALATKLQNGKLPINL